MAEEKIMKRAIVIFLLLFLCFPVFLFAETIVFKWGAKIESKIMEKTDKYIKIDFQGAPLIYDLNDIESIDGEKIYHKESLPSQQNNIDAEESEQGFASIRIPANLSQQNNIGVKELKPQSIPIRIEIPINWFSKEWVDYKTLKTILLISRDPIGDTYGINAKVSAYIIYSQNYLVSSSKWEEFITRFEETIKKQGYKISKADINMEKCGYPAFMLNVEEQTDKGVFLMIKINNNVLNITIQTPANEFSKYEKLFNNMLSSLTIENRVSLLNLGIALIRNPLHLLLVQLFSSACFILLTLLFLKLGHKQIPIPVGIVAGMEFSSVMGCFPFGLMIPFPPIFPAFLKSLLLAATIVHVCLGVMLLSLVKWARTAVLWLVGGAVLFAILKILMGGTAFDNIQLIWNAFGFIVYYLCLRREYFTN